MRCCPISATVLAEAADLSFDRVIPEAVDCEEGRQKFCGAGSANDAFDRNQRKANYTVNANGIDGKLQPRRAEDRAPLANPT